MKGTITGKDVVLHSASIVRHWGVAAYLSCLWAALTRKQTTFLRVLYPVPAELGGRRPFTGRAP
jgi:hypothetical protein